MFITQKKVIFVGLRGVKKQLLNNVKNKSE